MHQRSTKTTTSESTVLASLRALLPNRRLTIAEALRLAELQADRLLQLRGITEGPVPLAVVTELPRIAMAVDPALSGLSASGASHWDSARRCWCIAVNPDEPRTRQRFTALHEFKHILDHYHPGLLGRAERPMPGGASAEHVADYFAGCVLVPKRWLRAAYFGGIQDVYQLAELFDVSARAVDVRLDQLGLRPLTDPSPSTTHGCRLQRPSGRYFRALSHNSIPDTEEVVA